MKKIKKFIKNNIKLLIGLIIGIIISAGGVYAAIVIQGSSVGYTDNYSLGATTVQGAIDKLANYANSSTAIYYWQSTKKFSYKPPTGSAALYIKYSIDSSKVTPFVCIHSTTKKTDCCVGNNLAGVQASMSPCGTIGNGGGTGGNDGGYAFPLTVDGQAIQLYGHYYCLGTTSCNYVTQDIVRVGSCYLYVKDRNDGGAYATCE